MEELKLLIEMVSNLPAMAMWVLVGFWAYKVVVIGSIYGVIRLAINKIHNWLTTPKHELKKLELRPTIDGLCLSGQADALIAQLNRLRGAGTSINSGYIHSNSVDFLREAIDDKFAKDAAKAK